MAMAASLHAVVAALVARRVRVADEEREQERTSRIARLLSSAQSSYSTGSLPIETCQWLVSKARDVQDVFMAMDAAVAFVRSEAWSGSLTREQRYAVCGSYFGTESVDDASTLDVSSATRCIDWTNKDLRVNGQVSTWFQDLMWAWDLWELCPLDWTDRLRTAFENVVSVCHSHSSLALAALCIVQLVPSLSEELKSRLAAAIGVGPTGAFQWAQ